MILARSSALFAAAVSLCASVPSHALGTAAGTSIQSTTQVSYSIGGTSTTALSNTAAVVVGEILDAVVTIANPTATVSPGAAGQELVFTITNTGNGTEAFALAARSAGVAGDDFDPDLATPSIYFDSDDSGDLSKADIPYVAGTNDPVLAADAGVRVLLVNDIPAAAVDGSRGRGELTARALTGSGAPGTVFNAQGDGGVDAVAGITGADASLYGEYLVQAMLLTAIKSQTIVDASGGTWPAPGARINYQILVSASGTGTARDAAFSDLIPAHTTYVAGSLALNEKALTDAADGDAGEFVSTPAPEVRVNLGDLASTSGPQAIGFAVTIN